MQQLRRFCCYALKASMAQSSRSSWKEWVFQWRWQDSDKNYLMSVTGHALNKRPRSWCMLKNVALWTHFPLYKPIHHENAPWTSPGFLNSYLIMKLLRGHSASHIKLKKWITASAVFSPAGCIWYVYAHILIEVPWKSHGKVPWNPTPFLAKWLLRSKLCLELRAKKQAFVGKQNHHCWVLW